jgi:hypothetical protein
VTPIRRHRSAPLRGRARRHSLLTDLARHTTCLAVALSDSLGRTSGNPLARSLNTAAQFRTKTTAVGGCCGIERDRRRASSGELTHQRLSAARGYPGNARGAHPGTSGRRRRPAGTGRACPCTRAAGRTTRDSQYPAGERDEPAHPSVAVRGINHAVVAAIGGSGERSFTVRPSHDVHLGSSAQHTGQWLITLRT